MKHQKTSSGKRRNTLKKTEILAGIYAVDLAILADSALIITDIHIGFEEALNKQGILMPRFQFPEIIERMNKIFRYLGNKKFSKVIVNGDLKHEFGTISVQEWRNVLRFLDFLGRHCNETVIIKGNHDTALRPIAEKRGIKLADDIEIKYKKNSILVTHGDKIPANTEKYSAIIIGHEHPAVSLKHGSRAELYKCYLVGKYKKTNLIVQPSLNLVNEGADIMKEKLLSPFLQHNLDDFSVFVVEDKVYKFGRFGRLKSIE